MPNRSEVYARIRQAIHALPVIDCHEHTMGPQNAPENREPIAYLTTGYLRSDLLSVVYPGWPGDRPDMRAWLDDQGVPTEAKWPIFERMWIKTEHTAFARVTLRILRDVYGEHEMSLPALQRIRERLVDLRDPVAYRQVLDRANIRCRIVDNWPDMKAFLDGRYQVYDRDRLMISLPQFHAVRTWQNVWDLTQVIGASVTSLDGYLDACRQIFRRMMERGALGLKDQAAYSRTLAYSNPTRAVAEPLFNRLMDDPRGSLGWPEAKPLDDFLFHRFLEMARELEMPVQIHGGYTAGLRNDIAKTNAAHLAPVFELHRDVRFVLFHGNWPYLGECLNLGKTYPNVHVDLSCLPIIDPVYARNLLSEGLGVVPHGKFHAFGGDYRDCILHAEAHLSITRDVLAAALAEQVEWQWINESQALRIAADWLFNNPNDYYRLGLAPLEV